MAQHLDTRWFRTLYEHALPSGQQSSNRKSMLLEHDVVAVAEVSLNFAAFILMTVGI